MSYAQVYGQWQKDPEGFWLSAAGGIDWVVVGSACISEAERAGASHVSVTDSETGRTYCAPIDDVRRFGFPVVRGHGRQVALPLDRYSVDGEPPEAERRAAATNQERKELQLGLFGGAA